MVMILKKQMFETHRFFMISENLSIQSDRENLGQQSPRSHYATTRPF
jgi:hypothetical protein